MIPVSVPKLGDRTSGLLLHPTSLPGPHGNGDLGDQARGFVDSLVEGAQRWWQMLPVAPPGYGNSPYSAQSAFAGSPLLIALEPLVREGLLAPGDLEGAAGLKATHVDFDASSRFRGRALRAAFARFRSGHAAVARAAAFDHFCEENASWLDDYALYRALKRHHGEASWVDWPAEQRDRDSSALARVRSALSDDVASAKLDQFLFATQWADLRDYARARGVGLIGDIPIFVAHDSADVWQHQELFQLDPGGRPSVSAGVPPDYFSKTGQRWGNPLYRWARLRKSGYAWWIERFRMMRRRFDAIRLDHFIGYQRFWEVPAAAPTAEHGRWMRGPGADFFEALSRALGDLPLIAEDLGAVTPKVKALRDRFHFPGIKILQFAFGEDPAAGDFLPHNFRSRAVVYTGTHDNDTIAGWYHERDGKESTRSPAQAARERDAVLRYLGLDARAGDEGGNEIHLELIRLALASVARTAIFPVQDLLGLGSEARMNHPGRTAGNWSWRMDRGALTPPLLRRLRALTETYGRAAPNEDGRGKE